MDITRFAMKLYFHIALHRLPFNIPKKSCFNDIWSLRIDVKWEIAGDMTLSAEI